MSYYRNDRHRCRTKPSIPKNVKKHPHHNNDNYNNNKWLTDSFSLDTHTHGEFNEYIVDNWYPKKTGLRRRRWRPRLPRLSKVHLVEFVARTGYRHKPNLDEEGRPILNRTTPIHHAARRQPLNYDTMICEFFKIYDRFDVNYIDEDGLSHFHIACEFGLSDIVEQFLEIGQSPDCLVPLTGNSPLHLALYRSQYTVARVLLKNGADINLANSDGLTALHIACLHCHDHLLVKMSLRMYDDRHETVQIDARDKLGRTPLQWAVANLLPNMVDILLDHGADLSRFSFPTEDYFAERFKSQNAMSVNFKLRLATGALIVVERLAKRGYELELSEALVVMKLFRQYGLFEKPDDVENCWCKDEEFARKAKKIMMKPKMSLYEAILLSPDKAAKMITCWDYYRFARSEKLLELSWQSKTSSSPRAPNRQNRKNGAEKERSHGEHGRGLGPVVHLLPDPAATRRSGQASTASAAAEPATQRSQWYVVQCTDEAQDRPEHDQRPDEFPAHRPHRQRRSRHGQRPSQRHTDADAGQGRLRDRLRSQDSSIANRISDLTVGNVVREKKMTLEKSICRADS
ncbi:unnamed protein product [Trichogramma brassicae]|uniref:Uncharacterized protein n=1 Tax=Trichogramma brassicae TaxID=86971 RepID=A0A6H5IZH1_9HYME|nr:unnamed protein product [Trichogramma brassicae]